MGKNPRKRHPRLRRAFLFLGGAALLVLSVFTWLLVKDPRPGLLGTLPSGCGAKGDDFEIRCQDGLPYLVNGGLPYPTGFDSTDHPVQSLNGEWSMRFDPGEDGEASGWPDGGWIDDDTAWTPVRVPSTYNAPAGPHKGHEGVVWFARRFRAAPDSGGTWTRLAFQGVLLRSRVWLNGIHLGDREGGYTPFFFDVTGILRKGGENVLVVRADNRLTYASLPPRVRPRHNPVWGVYGGIYRDVYLESIPAAHILNARIAAYRDSAAAGFEGEVLIMGMSPGKSCTLGVNIRNPEGIALPAGPERILNGSGPQAVRLRIPLRDPMAWGPGRPAHYTFRLDLRCREGAESVWIVSGHRLLTADGPALRMDGRALFLKGISKMEDDPIAGQTQTDSTMRRDLDLIREMGANFIRLAHYPHHGKKARLARDQGLMLGKEIPYFHVGEGWSQWLVDFQGLDGFPFSSFGMKHLHREDLLLHTQKSLVEMIIRDVNNPAVILWSLGNESYSLNDRAGRVYAWLREAALAFDPSRPVSLAEMTYYVPWLDDRRSSPRYLDVVSVNMYYGWYFGEASGAAAHLDKFHARYPDKGILLSEFGAEADYGRADSMGVRTGDRVFFPRTYSEEYQARLLEAHVRAAWDRPYVIGVSPWVFADFYCPWFPRNSVPEYNTKGVMTRERLPKQGYNALRDLYRTLPDFREGNPGGEPVAGGGR